MLVWTAVQSMPQSFFGGTIHALPPAIQFLTVSDPAGEWSLAATWPAGVPPDTHVWIQFLIEDLSVLSDIILSNAVKGTSP